MKKTLVVALCGLFAAALSSGCSEPGSAPAATSDTNVTTAEHDRAAAEMKAGANELGLNADSGAASTLSGAASVPSNWSYDTDRDEMRNTTSHFASARSDTVVNVGSPYDPDKAELTLRKRPSDGQSVMLRAPGQFLCRSYNDDTVAVKFDDGPIQQFPCGEPSDATSGVIFIRSPGRFIEKLKASKRVIIEAEMYQAGRQQMTFSVEGLTWPPKAENTD